MPLFIHRTTFQTLHSTSPADLSEPIGNYVQDPASYSVVSDEPTKYWILTGDVFSLMDQSAQDVADLAESEARKDSQVEEVSTNELIKAIAQTNLDLFNAERLARGASQITPQQYKDNVRGNM